MSSSGTRRVHLTLACNRYDRTTPLLTGEIEPEGVSLNAIQLPIEEMFWRQLRFQEFDVSEMSFSAYTMLYARGESPWVGIPVFLSREFRHSSVYVRQGGDIATPEDIRGRRVGIPEFHMTAGVFVRGVLKDEYGVNMDDIEWFTGGQEEPGRMERVDLPKDVRVHHIGGKRTLQEMLMEGDIDALVAPKAPSLFMSGNSGIVRLFPNYREVEREYFRRTGIFPIMHIVAIRRALVEELPWLPVSLYKAFSRARDAAYERLFDTNALSFMLPWLVYEAEESKDIFEGDFWPYGVEANKPTLDAFCQYMHTQGLTPRRVSPEELFPESARTLSHI